MKKKRKMTIVVAVVTMLVSGLLFSCQQKPKQNEDMVDRAEVEFEKFKEDIEDLSENDPQFVDKLEKELIEFEATMEEIGENAEKSGDEATDEINSAINDIREEARMLKNKVTLWSDKTGDNLEDLGEEIKDDFKNFKESLRNVAT